MKNLLLLACFISLVSQAQTFTSTEQQTTLLQLYTSEGCSSCPKADRWLSSLKNDTRLWQDIIPVAFHVDYWNRIGWIDRFATSEFSARQRLHKKQKIIKGVYTPGLIVNDHEWKRWFSGQRQWPASKKSPGVLSANYNNENLHVKFNTEINDELQLNVALLGMNITTDVKTGENANKRLHHDFVVLEHQVWNGHGEWSVQFPRPTIIENHALAIWINKKGYLAPIQATGGLLHAKTIQPDHEL